jgi:hypothetical protein
LRGGGTSWANRGWNTFWEGAASSWAVKN